jgi:hypothetical protein
MPLPSSFDGTDGPLFDPDRERLDRLTDMLLVLRYAAVEPSFTGSTVGRKEGIYMREPAHQKCGICFLLGLIFCGVEG